MPTVSFSDPAVQETSTSLQGSFANDNSFTSPSCKLASVAHELTYRRAWKLYEEFQLSIYNNSHISLPIMPATLALFVAYLFDNKYASSTVNTYVSALGYYHRLAGLRDPTKTFYIREMLRVYGKISHKLDTRLPITLPVLVRMMQASTSFCVSQYQSYMFKAMCSMAFFSFLRIGEIKVSKQQSISSNLLQLGQVSNRCCGSGNVVSFRLLHSQTINIITIKILFLSFYLDNLKLVLFKHFWIMLLFGAH